MRCGKVRRLHPIALNSDGKGQRVHVYIACTSEEVVHDILIKSCSP